ncbi:MAG: glycosyltransferase involved in cell wall biosynthesis [Cycloclasticus pugetii]|uniref:glycosyltransferase family 4 protein n=1 Tax=Cycloclasticus pugetii TaxID=34068 RepID=UPI0039E2BF27
MNVLIINSSDIKGGAARATYRLHEALLKLGIESHMLVDTKLSDDYRVIEQDSNIGKGIALIRRILDRLLVNTYKLRSKTYFSSSLVPFSGLVKRINALNPDIVHLHWVNKAMLSISDIAAIKAPIVWSLHDMWAFTGGCHYDEGCGAFERACGECKVLGSNKANDLSCKVFKKKLATYAEHPNLTVVGLSRWLADCASKSKLFKKRQIVCLPNPIDTSVYSPLDKRTARDLLGLPMDKKLILFGAMNATSDPRKGYGELCEALMQLEGEGLELVVFGGSKPEIQQGFKLKAHYLGQLHDDVTLRALYSAADVMVVPSKQEAFGQTASESMSCGTPVVAFACTGLLDLVEHLKTGYLAKPYNTVDLAAGIEWVLHTPNYQELSINAREKVLNEFDSSVVAKQYIQLYESVLEKQDYD